MSDQVPTTGHIKVRVLEVNTLTQGELVHDVKARVLPRGESRRPVMLRLRDEICPRPPRAGDRLRLTMQLGEVAGVEVLKPPAREDADSDGDG